jgi:hypothetical protein
LCPTTFNDVVRANNHAWNNHGDGKFTTEIQPTVVFSTTNQVIELSKDFEAQVGTRFSQMQYTQLEEKARDNKLKRCILIELVLESNFAATNSKFYRLAKGRAPCFKKTSGRLSSFSINCADGPVRMTINMNEPEALLVWKRIQPVLILEAQIGFGVTHTHNVNINDDTISTFMRQATSALEKLCVVGPIVNKILSFICKMCIAVRVGLDPTVILCLVSDALITSGLDLAFATEVINAVRVQIHTFMSWVLGTHVAQADVDDPITAFATFVAVVGGALIMHKMPSFGQVANCVLGVTKLGNFVRGASFAWSGLEKILSVVLAKVYEWHTGFPSSIVQMEKLIGGTQNWYLRVQDMIKLNTSDEISRNSEKCIEVESLYTEGVRMSAMLQEFKVDQKTMSAFQTHMQVVRSLYDKVQSSGAFRGGPRVEPILIYLSGESGVGKSGLTLPLAIDLLKIDGIPDNDYTREIYTRMSEMEYWDAYRGQRICVYDDFAQVVDSVAKPNPEFMEMIRCGNLTTYPLHMASLEEKAKTYFRSRVVIMTTNTPISKLKPISIGHPEAVRRRMDICARVLNVPEFTSRDGNGVARLDTDKVFEKTGETLSMKVYLIQMCDPATGNDVGAPISYEEFALICVRKYRARFDKSRSLFDFLSKRAEGPSIDTPTDELPKSNEKDIPFTAEISEGEMECADHPRAQICVKDAKEVFLGMDYDGVKSFIETHGYIRYLFTTEFTNTISEFETLVDEENEHLMSVKDLAAFKEDFIEQWKAAVNTTSDFYRLHVEETILNDLSRMMGKARKNPNYSIMDDVEEFQPFVASVRVRPLAKLERMTKRLEDLASDAKSGFSDWVSKAKEALMNNKWFAALAVVVPIVIFTMYKLMPERPKLDKTILDHRHEGLTIGKREKHSHKCQWCGKFYSHTHKIRPYEESVKYPHLCVPCQSIGIKYRYLGDNEVVVFNDTHIIETYTNFPVYEGDNKECCSVHQVPEPIADFYENRVGEGKEFPTLDLFSEVLSSGDSITVKKQTMRTELAPSGDAVTVKSKTLRAEKSAKKPRTEFSSDGDISTMKSNFNRTTPMPVILESELGEEDEEQTPLRFLANLQTDPNAEQVSHKVINNAYTITLCIDDKWNVNIKCVMIRGRICLTVAHLKPFLEKSTHVKLWNKNTPDGHTFPTSSLTWRQVHDANGEEKDQLLIAFPISLHDHSDITGNIAGSKDIGSFHTVNGVLVVPSPIGMVLRYGLVRAFDKETKPLEYKEGATSYYIRDRYEYMCLETTKGDCGSLLIGVNSKLQRKILGVHVAGAVGVGVASPLNIRDINECLDTFPREAQVGLDLSPYLTKTESHKVKLPEGNFVPVGKSLFPVMGARQTQLRQSHVYGMVTEPTTMPSILRPVMIGDKLIDPMQLGLKKAGKIPPYLDEKILGICINDATRVINSNALPEHQQVLSPIDAVKGIEGDEFLGPIKRKSSPGYPWIRDKVGPGKTKWLGNDENYQLDSDLEKVMEKRIEMARNNERYPTIWIDTLKDERRPIEKVLIGKTRVFAAGAMDFTLVFRMFFMGFAAHVSRNRIGNEVSVGTNVYSHDWTRTATRMKSKGDKVIAGDFSNFDGTLILQILHRILEIINDFYNDGEENAQIRKILWKEVTNSVHLCGDNVYLWTHSQPSGCPLTAILNSIFNSVSMRYVWMIVVEKERRTMKEFNRCVAMVSYGDDNLVNISDDVVDQFNQITIAQGYATIGMTYTDESKSGDMIPFRSLSECSYLKRSFIWNADEHQWVAPLELGVVLEMINWIRGDLDTEEATATNMEASAFELSLHGEEVFDKWISKYKDASRDFFQRPFFFTYSEYREVEAVKYGRLNN